MTRLGLLIVLLAVVVAAAIVVQLRVVPEIALSDLARQPAPSKLSRADQRKLEGLKERFAEERDRYLRLRNTGAPADQLKAQSDKANAAAKAVVALGGTEALKTVGKSKFAPTTVSGPGDRPDQAPATRSGGEGESGSGEEGARSTSLDETGEAKPGGKGTKPASVAEPAVPAEP